MTDTTAQEPTMEEILASIRRIISEDDAPATPAPVAAAPDRAPVAAPEPTPFPLASPALMDETPSVQEPVSSDDDVLELTDEYEAPASESIGDLDVSTPEPEPVPWSAPEPTPPPETSYDSLVGESAAASAASAFAGLHASLKKPEPAPVAVAPTPDLSFLSGSTVEGMVVEMLKPLLKGWLDANLPGIVDAAVKKEVERISRSAG